MTITAASTTFGQTADANDVDMYKINLTHGLFYSFNLSGGAN